MGQRLTTVGLVHGAEAILRAKAVSLAKAVYGAEAILRAKAILCSHGNSISYLFFFQIQLS